MSPNTVSRPSDDEVDALYARLATDFEFWCATCCKIRTKVGTIVPFELNRVQKRFLEVIDRQLKTRGYVRIVVLKARQQGLSTLIMAWQYWWLTHHVAQKGLVMAHEAESTTSLFDMYRRCHENQPDLIRPVTKYSSRTELVFQKLDSALRVATAGGRGVARGETLTTTHLSEVAFWPVAFANQNFSGLIKAVPQVAGTAVFVESTANGLTGKFREVWTGAVEGKNEFEAFFSAWMESDEYRLPASQPFSRTFDEVQLADYTQKHYGIVLDDDQLQWRRVEIARDGIEMFHQECPSDADEAFISTGAPVFDPDTVSKRLKLVGEPKSKWLVTNGAITENAAGELLVYVEHAERDTHGHLTGEIVLANPKETYVIGADVGLGIRPDPERKKSGKDFSVAQILDSQMRQVAVWRGYCHPDYFATILRTLGHKYNDALIAPERNNHGLLTCVRLRDLHYSNIYCEEVEGRLDEEDTINIGVLTTEKLKPLMIDKLRAAIRKNEIQINDATTLKEMLSYVVTPSGRMEGDGDAHDDTVMALAIATHIHEGLYTIPPVGDEFYVEAI
jgi:hypothetical protein